MAKGTLPVRGSDGAAHSLVAEVLGGGKHQILHVATAIPTVISHQTLTVGTTSGSLASFCSGAALPSNATHALFRVFPGGGDVYWIDDGSDNPSATNGFPAEAGDWGEWVNLAGVELVASVASTLVAVSFRRYDA